MNRSVEMGAGDEPDNDQDTTGALLVTARADPEAFGAFYLRTNGAVLAFFLRRTGSPHLAHELTAETFAEALAGLRRYRPELGTGRAWLFGIASNRFRQYLRREQVSDRARRKVGAMTPELTESDIERIETLVDFGPLVSRLDAALDELTEPLRNAVRHRFIDDLPYEEIARRGECTINNARVRVARGLDRLAVLMGTPL